MDVDHSCDMRTIDENYCYMDSSFNNKAKRNYIHPCVQSLKAVVTAGLCLTLAASGVTIATATLAPQQAFAQDDESDAAIIQFKDQNLKNALLARMKELKLIKDDATDITIKQARDAAEKNDNKGIGYDASKEDKCSDFLAKKDIKDITGLYYFLKDGFYLNLDNNHITDISDLYSSDSHTVKFGYLSLKHNDISVMSNKFLGYIEASVPSTFFGENTPQKQRIHLDGNHIVFLPGRTPGGSLVLNCDMPNQSITKKISPVADEPVGTVYNLSDLLYSGTDSYYGFDKEYLYNSWNKKYLKFYNSWNKDIPDDTIGELIRRDNEVEDKTRPFSGSIYILQIKQMPRDYKILIYFKEDRGFGHPSCFHFGWITLDFSDYLKRPYKKAIDRYLALDASTQKSVKFTNADKDSKQAYTDAITAVQKLDIENATTEDVQTAATKLGYAYDGLNGVPGASADNTALTDLTNAIKALNDNNQKLAAAIEELKKSKSDTPAGTGDSSKDQKIAELTKKIEELQKKVEALSKGQGGSGQGNTPAGGGSTPGGSNPSQGGTAGGGSTQGGTNPSQGGSSTGGSGEGNTPAGGGTSQGGSTQGGTSQGGSSTGGGSTSGNTSGTTSGSGSTSGAILGGFSVGSIGAVSEDKPDTCMLYRLYNPYTHEHLFTIDKQEKENCAAHGWRDEGAIGKVLKEKGTEVYRIFNPYTGEHHFTTDAHEVELRSKEGWVNEGVQFHSADKDSSGAMGMVSFFNPYEKAYTHHYTSDAQEMAKLRAEGWKQEVAKWYCLPVTEKDA